MRYIQLVYNDFELFDTAFNETSYIYYCTHRDAFRQMLKEQGKEFWIRFLLSFRSFHSHYGFIALMLTKTSLSNEVMDWFFIRLHEQFIDGSPGDSKQLFEDISLVIKKRHLLLHMKSKSFGWLFSNINLIIIYKVYFCSIGAIHVMSNPQAFRLADPHPCGHSHRPWAPHESHGPL
jgi:Na+/melibiose symporter-like transporter